MTRASALTALGFTLGWAAVACGQMHHVDAPEHVTRAVGVYEWTGDLSKPNASRFVPVSLFIDGHFEDAGLYLARPVPFALQSGDLYTVERSGEPTGMFDLQSAERVVTGNALAADDPAGAWYGFGTFNAQAAEKPGPALRRSAHLSTIQSSSGENRSSAETASSNDADNNRPHMSRRGASGSSSQDKTDTSDTSKSTSSTPGASGGDDTDRPTLARRDPSQDASRRRTPASGKNATASVTAVGPQPGDDPDRPTLSHKAAADDGPQALTGMPADLHQAVAVSDAVSREAHPFARPWEDNAEKASVTASMAAIATPAVNAYLAKNHLLPSSLPEPASGSPAASSKEDMAGDTSTGAGAPPKLQRGKPTEYNGENTTPPSAHLPAKKTPATVHTARKSAPAASAPTALKLQGEDVRGFLLSYGGLPTFVYTASTGAVAKDAGDLPAAATHPLVTVTVVAQRLPSGDLQVAFSSVTDSLHLDRTPRFRLIDAVDPDASHRASLLFELRGSNSRQFALYRLVTARAENTFTSASIE